MQRLVVFAFISGAIRWRGSCCCHFSVFCSVELLHVSETFNVFQAIPKNPTESHNFFLFPADTYLSAEMCRQYFPQEKLLKLNLNRHSFKSFQMNSFHSYHEAPCHWGNLFKLLKKNSLKFSAEKLASVFSTKLTHLICQNSLKMKC